MRKVRAVAGKILFEYLHLSKTSSRPVSPSHRLGITRQPLSTTVSSTDAFIMSSPPTTSYLESNPIAFRAAAFVELVSQSLIYNHSGCTRLEVIRQLPHQPRPTPTTPSTSSQSFGIPKSYPQLPTNLSRMTLPHATICHFSLSRPLRDMVLPNLANP